MIENVFVVGAGFMGSGIVENVAVKGMKVSVYDVCEVQLEKSKKSIAKSLNKRIAKGKMTEEEKDAVMERITFVTDLAACRNCDLVIEAVAENKAIKESIFKDVEKYVSEEAIIASNTSSISITALASILKKPERFVGLHFFSPVPKMPLLEIVKGFQTSDEVLEVANNFGEKMGKTCITSNDEAGFLINRMLLPMLNQAIVLVERHVGSIEEIDIGMKQGLHHPMGPLELLDMIGLDVELAVMEEIHRETGDSRYRPAVSLRRMVDAGYLGRKTGIGFYIYDEEGEKTPNTELQNKL